MATISTGTCDDDIDWLTADGHPVLRKLSKEYGSATRLCRVLGVVDDNVFCQWAKLHDYPSVMRCHTQTFSRYGYADLDAAFAAVTPLLIDDIWPQWLRDYIDCRRFPGFARTLRVAAERWDTRMYARMQACDPATLAHLSEMVDVFKRMLPKLRPRDAEVVKMLFGLGKEGGSPTLDEVGRVHKITRERVRQVSMRGLRDLERMGNVLSQFLD